MGKTMASGGIDDEQRDFRKKMLCSSISQKEVVGLAVNEATIFGTVIARPFSDIAK